MIDQMLISMLSGVKWRVVAVLRPQRDEAEDALVVARAELEKRELHADRLEEEGVSVVEHAVRLLLRHVQLLSAWVACCMSAALAHNSPVADACLVTPIRINSKSSIRTS